MTKLQITLTDEEGALLSEQAMLLGYDVTKYAKFVLAQKAIEQLTAIPTHKASANIERIIRKGREEYRKGNTKTRILGQYDHPRSQ
ncbi:hypothetical protein HY339_03540 [Candidatus Gottesmanbacteria bacterium]|nr:hypothetical protein [Candidatus Gottesmanbacteria bacterium]